MQRDIHYYGTYTIARLAGFGHPEAETLAYASQFVDDASGQDSRTSEEGAKLIAARTAHHPVVDGMAPIVSAEMQRLVWVPFHFYPAGYGESLQEKLLVVEDGPLINEAFSTYLSLPKLPYGLHLLGIVSHAYLDTFAHFGFSGISSKLNQVKDIELYLEGGSFLNRLKEKAMLFWDEAERGAAELLGWNLGHGQAATYPDKPFLRWRYEEEIGRLGEKPRTIVRDNHYSTMKGLRALYLKLLEAADKFSGTSNPVELPTDALESILNVEGDKNARENVWKSFINERFGEELTYDSDKWESELNDFTEKTIPLSIGNLYRFHQAAQLHRWYSLKHIFPGASIYLA